MSLLDYLDANVLVLAILADPAEGESGHGPVSLLRRLEAGTAQAATASLALDEVCWSLRRQIGRPRALAAVTRILHVPNLRVLPVTAEHVRKAMDLMGLRAQLRPRDAIHAAVALDAGIHTIVSTDSDFDGIEGLTRRDPA